MLAAHNVLAFETVCPVLHGNKAECETRLDGRGLKANQDVTFKAPSGRRTNVDRVIISGGTCRKRRPADLLIRAPKTARQLGDATEGHVNPSATSNADSYSRCFRVSFDAWVARNDRYLPIVTAESQDMWGLGSSPRFKANSSEFLPKLRTEQGGCLYEWPEVRLVPKCRKRKEVMYSGLTPRSTDGTNWQKPGIGIAAVSPVERNSTTVFRPDRTGLRKTPSSWLPANVIQKDHPGFVLIGLKVKESPFLSRGL